MAIFSLALKPEELGEPWSEIAQLIDTREYTSAINLLQNYARSSSGIENLSEIYYRIGFIHHEYTHYYDQALDAYQKVVDLSKDAKSASDPEPFLALSRMSMADIYRRTGRYEDAIQMYKTVMANYPGTEYVAIAAKDVKGIQDALTEIKLQQQVIDKYPGTEFAAEAQFEIAELYLSVQNLNNPQRAIEEYTKVVEQYPNSHRAAEALLKIGNAYRTLLHEPEKAIAAYQKLVQGQFSSSKLGSEALFRIGRIYHSELRDYKRALDVFSMLLRDYPAYWRLPAVIYWKAMCYEQMKDYDNAIKAYEMFVQIYPDEESSLLADIGRLGERDVKTRIISKIEELKKLIPEARWSEAEQLRSVGKHREALVIYQELMSEYPNSEYSSKAKIQADKVRNLAEIQICRDIIKSKGIEAPASQYRIAEIYEMDLHDLVRAIEEYEKVVENYPGTYWAADALYRMGLIYSGLDVSNHRLAKEDRKKNIKQDYNKAIEKFLQLIRQYPNTYTAAEAYYQTGEIYRIHLKNYDQALEAYRKVVDDYPRRNLYVGEGYTDSLADEAQFNIGRIYYENLQNYDMALKTFTKFLKDYPNSCRTAAVYSFTSAIHEKQKANKAAVNSLEQIIDIIVDSDVQASFFIRDALYVDLNSESGLSGFDLQRDIIKQIKKRISQLQEQD